MPTSTNKKRRQGWDKPALCHNKSETEEKRRKPLNVKENVLPKPVFYIIKFSFVGYDPLPLPKFILDPME